MGFFSILYVFFSILITLFYAVLVLYYLLGWQSISPFKPAGRISNTKITVIVCARNEQHNILTLLNCLKNQDYPSDLFEVIVVDDHSDDLTPEIVENYEMRNLQLLHLDEYVRKNEIAFKKRAVEFAIQNSTGKLIVTTDADCSMGTKWLSTIAEFYEETNSKFIVAPVDYLSPNSLLEKLQNLDFLSIMGITGASVHHKLYNLSNGANMAYERDAFLSVNGYHKADNSPSGDDVFLIEKMGKQFPHQINYLKNRNAIVFTNACTTLPQLIQQRIRWIAKTKHYTDLRTRIIALLVLIFYLSIAFSVLLCFINIQFMNILLMQLILKSMVDYALVDEVTRFFKKRKLLRYFLILELTHFPFNCYVGVKSQFTNYTWKKRKYKE